MENNDATNLQPKHFMYLGVLFGIVFIIAVVEFIILSGMGTQVSTVLPPLASRVNPLVQDPATPPMPSLQSVLAELEACHAANANSLLAPGPKTIPTIPAR